MALPQQKKRFSFFGSPPMSPILSPTKSLSNYFSSHEKQDDKLPNIEDVRKAVDNLERLVVAAEAYRDLTNKLTKASKTLCKTLKDYGNSKGMENVHVMCFQTTSQFYDDHTEIQLKLNKALQKDFDSIQKFWDKYSKKMAKDEKVHNDFVGDLDKQLKRMNKEYEKKAKKENKASLESHNQYMTSVTNIGSEIARAQKEHAEKVAKREKKMHSVISQIICKIAEGHFAYFNESLKKCGPNITKMKEWAPFAGEDMPPPQSLDSFLEDLDSQSQSDKNSTSSERNPASVTTISSISDRQIAAMNFSQESKLQFNEEPENINPIKYVQSFEPKHPVIITPEPTKPTHTRSLILDGVFNLKDENTYNSSLTSTIPSLPIVQPTSAILSKFSIGIHDGDKSFLRDEKVVEVHHPEVLMESKVEKNVLNRNPFKNQEKSNEPQNVTNDIKNNNKKDDEKKDERKNDEKKEIKKTDDEKKEIKKTDDEKREIKKTDDEKRDNERKDNEKKDEATKLQDKHQPEKKDIFTPTKRPPLNRNSTSDGSNSSNTTLNDDKKSNNNEKSNGELKNVKENESKKELRSSEKLITKIMNMPIKDKEKETTNESDDSLRKLLENTGPIIPGGFPFKHQETLINSSPPSQSPSTVPRQTGYSRDDDYRKEYSREDSELYNNNERRMNRFTNREINRDESLLYNNSPVLEERIRYDDRNLNYIHTQRYDDDYESYDYSPSQNRGSYITRDKSPPRTNLSYSPRHSIPVPSNRNSSVREMTNRFQSMNEERRSVSPQIRNVPMQTGRVSEMTSRFGEGRNKREEIINPPHISHSRSGYENVDDRYNDPIEYRDDRYIQYNDDPHDGMTPVRYCDCHNCRMAVENYRLHPRHSNSAPFNPRTDSNFGRKNYH